MKQTMRDEENGITIELAHISTLRPDGDNIRRHTPRNLAMIGDSLQEVGAMRSIVIDEENEVHAGSGTWEGAAERGIEKVIIIETAGDALIAHRRTGLQPLQWKRYEIEDNYATDLSSFDEISMAELAESMPEALAGIYTDDEIASLIEQHERMVELSLNESEIAGFADESQFLTDYQLIIPLSKEQPNDTEFKKEIAALCEKYALTYKMRTR